MDAHAASSAFAEARQVSQVGFREAMRHLAGGVCIVTAGRGEDRTGMTVTSVSSLSVDPPTLLVSVNRQSSSWGVIERYRRIGINVLSADHRDTADRFSGRSGHKGTQRYEGSRWLEVGAGAPLLEGALVAFDCDVEELIERHSHAIVIGRVRAIRTRGGSSALVYWRGEYDQLGWTEEEVSRAVGLVSHGARPYAVR